MRFLPLGIMALALGIFFYAARDVSALGLVVTLIVAFASWPLAHFGSLLAAGAGPRDMNQRANLAWSALFPSLVLLMAALGTGFGAGPWLSPLLGAALAALVFAWAARLWFTPLRPIFELRRSLPHPERLAPAAEALVQDFERAPRHVGARAMRGRANRAIAAVAIFSDARRWSDARRVLATVSFDDLDPLRRATLEASRAVVLLYDGDRDGAWAALKEASLRAKDPTLLAAVTTTDALLTALDGHGAEALTRLDAVPEQSAPRVRRALLIARSHALAAKGDRDAARACLETLAAEAVDGLERVIELRGPASELALELAASRKSS